MPNVLAGHGEVHGKKNQADTDVPGAKKTTSAPCWTGRSMSRGSNCGHVDFLHILVQGPVTKNSNRFLGGDLTTRGASMDGLRLRSWHIAVVLRAANYALGMGSREQWNRKPG